jgi:hypothetical protein
LNHIVYLYYTYVEHRCSFSTDPTRRQLSFSLACPDEASPPRLGYRKRKPHRIFWTTSPPPSSKWETTHIHSPFHAALVPVTVDSIQDSTSLSPCFIQGNDHYTSSRVIDPCSIIWTRQPSPAPARPTRLILGSPVLTPRHVVQAAS